MSRNHLGVGGHFLRHVMYCKCDDQGLLYACVDGLYEHKIPVIRLCYIDNSLSVVEKGFIG